MGVRGVKKAAIAKSALIMMTSYDHIAPLFLLHVGILPSMFRNDIVMYEAISGYRYQDTMVVGIPVYSTALYNVM